jgi:HK97 family phage portal protein
VGALFGRREVRAHAFPEPVIPPFPGVDLFGRSTVATKPDQALMVPTVWACVGLLANAVSMLPLETFRRTSGVPARITDPPVVTSPAAGMTQSEWLHMLMVSLLLRGNAYGLIVSKDSFQRPTQIELLNPDLVTPKVADDGTVTYTVRSGAQTTTYTRDKIWHVRGLTLPGSKIGLSPIAYAAATLGVDLSSRQFASDYFDGGGIPKAVLTTDQQVNQEQASTIKQRLLAAVRQREPIVLGAGLNYKQIQVNPEESQFLATQQANVAQVARYFWIPPEMVGGSGGNSMTYANVEQRQLDFFTLGVSFWLKRIEDAFFPFLPQPQYVAFNPMALLRTDAETQAKVWIQLLAGKVVAPSEVRAEYNRPPMTDEQKAEADMVPLTVTPLGGAKALPGLKQPPGPVAPVPPSDDQGGSDAAA